MHLHVHINAGNNREDHGDTQYDGVDGVVLFLGDEEGAEVDDDDLFGESEECCDCEMPKFNIAGSEHSGRKM